jgi:lipopolysaccharide assembly outer membrane protein LptD (OstA)
MDIRKKDIIFEGRPALITEDKKVLGGDKITWNNNSQRLFAQGRCFIGAGGETKEADRVHADVALNNFTMEGSR